MEHFAEICSVEVLIPQILWSLMIVRSMLVYQRPATAIDTRGMMGMADIDPFAIVIELDA